MRSLLILLLALVWAIPASAQTPAPVLSWDYDVSPTEVASYTQAITVDGAPVAAMPTCAPRQNAPQETTCSLPAPELTPGPHTVAISATKNGITATTTITGLDRGTGAHNPRNPRVTVSVTVTVN